MSVLVHLDERSKTPIYKQIFQQIKDMIEKKILLPGTRIPSCRKFAQKLGINRSTVYNAYQELWGRGYIESMPGTQFVVRKKVDMVTSENKKAGSIIDWENHTNKQAEKLYCTFKKWKESSNPKQADTIDLASFEMDMRLFPQDDFRRCINQTFCNHGNYILTYGDRVGFQPLREYIANRMMQMHGISVKPEEILIANGSQNAIDLILRILCTPDKKIAIELPTYALILPLLGYYQAQIVGIPMKDDGMDLDYLENVLEKENLAFVYTMPNFHNPTGITTTQAHRERLLGLCEKHKVPIVEDGFEEEMKYFGKVPLPIKSMDKNNIVIYLSTFSKVLFPGIRIGWIIADADLIQRICMMKRFSELSSSMFVQAIVHQFCGQGYYDAHLRHMHKVFRGRMEIALKSLREYMPKGNVRWTEPAGGYLFWVELADMKIGKEGFYRILAEQKVQVSPGHLYFPGYFMETKGVGKEDRLCFRLCISGLTEEEIVEGIKRLGKAITIAYGKRGELE